TARGTPPRHRNWHRASRPRQSDAFQRRDRQSNQSSRPKPPATQWVGKRMSEPRISEQADSDLEEAWDYLAQTNEPAADRLLDGILKAARLHAQFPLMGRPRDDLAANLLSFVVLPYV